MRWLNRAHVYDRFERSNMVVIASVVRVKYIVVLFNDGAV